jgi:hypothetical protein
MRQSFVASDTLAAQRIICLNTSNQAAYGAGSATGASYFPLGISVDDCKTGQGCPVAGPGEIARLYFNDTCSTGALVGSDSSGRGIAFAGVAGTSYYVGILVDSTVAATATIADVFVCPGAVTSA